MNNVHKTLRKYKQSVPLWFFAFIPYKLGESVLITLLPLFIVQVVGGSIADVAKLSSINALVGMLAFILWGNLSDWLGFRRPFLILGFLTFPLCMSFISLADTISEMMLFSALGAFFMATITPISSALVIESFSEAKWPKLFGEFYRISGWSFVVGVSVGITWLSLFSGWWGTVAAMRSLLLLAGVVSLLSLILCLLWVKEPPVVHKQRKFHPKMIGTLSVGIIEKRAMFYSSRVIYFVFHPTSAIAFLKQLGNGLGIYYLCSLLFFFGINLVFIPLPIFLTENLKASNVDIFLIAIAKSTVESWLYVPMGKQVQKCSGLKLQIEAIAIRCGIFVIFATLAMMPPERDSLVVIGCAQILSGVTWAAISVSSSTMVAVLAPKNKEGLAIGFYNAIVGASAALGSLVSGYLVGSFGYAATFGTAALLTGLTAVCFWYLEPVMVNKTA
jgi:MFS family permease